MMEEILTPIGHNHNQVQGIGPFGAMQVISAPRSIFEHQPHPIVRGSITITRRNPFMKPGLRGFPMFMGPLGHSDGLPAIEITMSRNGPSMFGLNRLKRISFGPHPPEFYEKTKTSDDVNKAQIDNLDLNKDMHNLGVVVGDQVKKIHKLFKYNF